MRALATLAGLLAAQVAAVAASRVLDLLAGARSDDWGVPHPDEQRARRSR